MAKKGCPTKITPANEQKYLEYFEATGRVHDSAVYIGVTDTAILHHRKDYPEFEERYQAARGVFCDKINREVYRRAVLGSDKSVYYKGQVVGRVSEYSDRMLELIAKRYMPEYREQAQVEVNVNAGVLVVPGVQAKDEVWEKAYRLDEDGNAVDDQPPISIGHNIERS